MKMSEAEKLGLLMLSEIHQHLGVSGDVLDAAFIKEAIYSGNSWAISHRYSAQAYAVEDHSEEEAGAVFDALDMWRFLEESYSRLGPTEKAEVDAVNHGPVELSGFDGHEDQLGIARFIMGPLGLYPSLKGRADADCHFPVKTAYANMVTAFTPIRARLSERTVITLSAEEIVQILDARRS